MLAWLRFLFSLLILGGLAALAWWGHHTGWSMTGHGKPDPTPARDEVVVGTNGRVAFATRESVVRAGLDFAAAYEGPLEETLTAPATVALDPKWHAKLSARAAGTVWRVRKHLGDRVAAGAVLALIDAPEVGRARAELAQALLQTRIRTTTVEALQRGAALSSASRLREAETALLEAQVRLTKARQELAAFGVPAPESDLGNLAPEQLMERLRFQGVPADIVASLSGEKTACLLPVVAPFAGEVLALEAVTGEAVEVGRVLFVVADPSRLWLRLALKAEDAGRVRVGHVVRFQGLTAPIEQIAPGIDETTRTVAARVVLDNASGKVRVGTYGPATITVRTVANGLLVPRAAVVRKGDATFAVVRERRNPDSEATTFSVRPVRVGTQGGEQVEIVSGIAAGEVVVTAGAARLLDLARRNLPGGP